MRLLYFLFFLIGFLGKVQAQTTVTYNTGGRLTYNLQWEGDQIDEGDTLKIHHPVFSIMDPEDIQTVYNGQFVTEFKLEAFGDFVFTDSVSIRLRVKHLYYDLDSVLTSVNDTIDLFYTPQRLGLWQGLSVIRTANNVFSAGLIIESFEIYTGGITGVFSAIANVLQGEVGQQTQQTQQTQQNLTEIEIALIAALKINQNLLIDIALNFECEQAIEVSHSTLEPQVGEDPSLKYTISWDLRADADEYDLEWTFFDDQSNEYGLMVNNEINGQEADAYFLRNASRVTVRSPFYSLFAIYPKGRLLYRVRAVKYHPVDGRSVTPWSTAHADNASVFTDFIALADGHQPDMNWEYQVIFAEEGKAGRQINYFDRTLRSRQQQSYLNTEETSVIGETHYDKMGRAAMTILPVPAFKDHLNYNPQFNKNSQGNILGYENMPECNIDAEPLDNSTGAGAYYSDQNQKLSDPLKPYMKFVPDAEGFPFTTVQYTSDLTGRQTKSSSPGEKFRFGNGRDTRHFYGVPSQLELDRLFGSEAGLARFYKKNAVMDPNRQVSVSLLNEKDQVVATYLAGEVPENLNALESYPQKQSMVLDMLQSGILSKNELVSSQPLIVTDRGDVEFYYNMSGGSYEPDPECLPEGVCYHCAYDLEIIVTDECGEILNDGGLPYVENNFSYESLANSCSQSPEGLTYSFTIQDMDPGQYQVFKRLTVNQEKLEQFYNDYLENQICSGSLEQQLNEELERIGQMDCEVDCDQCQTIMATGAKEEFINNFIEEWEEIHSDTLGSYVTGRLTFESLRQACEGSCDPEYYDPCESLLTQMLVDLTPPFGQYAKMKYDDQNDLYEVDHQYGEFQFNVLDKRFHNVTNWSEISRSTARNYTNLELVYKEPDGTPILVNLPTVEGVEPWELTPDEFTRAFKPEWAAVLLPLHPEYEYYEWCKDKITKEHNDYETRMMAIDNFEDARLGGYLNPLAAEELDAFYPISQVGTDPFFQTELSGQIITGLSITPYLLMRAFMNSVPMADNNNTSSGLNIWELVAVQLCEKSSLCDPDAGNLLDEEFCQADKNRAWQMFKSLYITLRKRVMYVMRESTIICLGKSNGLIGRELTGEAGPGLDYSNSNNCGTGQGMMNHVDFNGTTQINNGSSLITYNFFHWATPRAASDDFYRRMLLNQQGAEQPQDEQQANEMGNELLAKSITESCEGMAKGWIVELERCFDQQTTLELKVQLQDALVAICSRAGDLLHPNGATSLPDGRPSVMVNGQPCRSFQDVLEELLNISPSNLECGDFLISMPGKYGMMQTVGTTPVTALPPDECICTRLDNLSNAFNGYMGDATTLSEYISEIYGQKISQQDLDLLANLCDESPENCLSVDPPIELPPVLECNQCLDCIGLAKQMLDFNHRFEKKIFDSSDPENNRSALWVAYLNHRNGFSLSFDDYSKLLVDCGGENFAEELLTSIVSVQPDEQTQTIDGPNDYCLELSKKINDFNLTRIQPGEQGYSIELTSYLNEFTQLDLTFSHYVQFIESCGLMDQTGLSKLPVDTLEQVNCMALRELIENLGACSQSVPPGEYCGQLNKHLNGVLGFSYPFSFYQQRLIACFGETEADQILEHANLCQEQDAEPDCRGLARLIDSWRSMHAVERINQQIVTVANMDQYVLPAGSYGNDPDRLTVNPSAIVGYLNRVYVSPQRDLCDYVDILFECYDPVEIGQLFGYQTCEANATLDDLIRIDENGTSVRHSSTCNDHSQIVTLIADRICPEALVIPQPVEQVMSCQALKGFIDQFNQSNPGLSGDEYYIAFTLQANLQFKTRLTYCEFFTRASQCLESNDQAAALLGGYNSYCEKECFVLGNSILRFNMHYYGRADFNPNIANLEAHQQKITSMLNKVMNQQKTFCDWFTMFANCSDLEQANLKLGPRGNQCSGEPEVCRNCDDLVNAIQNIHSQFGQQANYPLLLASQLNTTFEWNLTFRQYLALYRQCHDGEWDPFAYQFVVPRQEYIVKRDPLTNPYGIDYPDHPVYLHLSNNSVAMACNRNFSEINPTEDDCMDQVTQMAMANVLNVRKEWEAQQRTNFIREYTNTCLSLSETFTATLEERSHHFTLYFYDQAGNLAKTVPPEGVELITEPNELTQVINHRSDPILNQPFFAEHTYETHYWYNSLNQVIKQETPDGGVTRFWYDHLGRLVLSQSAKQLAMGDGVSPIHVYSYTKYDDLNRIIEVGELVASNPINEYSILSSEVLFYWEAIWVNLRRNVVRTFYDIATFEDVQESFGPAGQENLRSRVASVAYYNKGTQANDQYNHASHYSYDISGNVKTLIQANRYLAKIGHQYKRIDYEYDLVSGKVNEVKYQTDSLDEFFQRYIYDADNRLEESESSRNGIVYRTDARYQYYPHGPLARTIIGDGVQGQDYVYTLQGWIKSVNSPLLDKTADPGADGLDQSVSADVYGYSLGYYQGDYLAIGRNEEGFKSPEPIYSGTDFDEASPSLYNGNIRHMTVGLSQVQTNESNTIGYAYAYDQLNRLTGMDAWSGINPETGTWTATEALEAYKERVSYDQNGNILGYLRNGSSVEPLMDSLTYKYIPGKNRLRKVNDQVGIGNYSVDIDDHDEVAGEELYENYEYDESGNLTRDKAEDIDAIYWTPYGKIDSIVKIDGTQLKYYYDATGNRTGKRMYQGTDTTNTWYVRDAQGNVLTVYTQQGTIQLQLAENHLYGSSRLGLYAQDAQLFPKPVSMSSFLNLLLYKEGVKSYELTNHLGNVLATVSDVKIGQVIEDENVFHAIPRNQQDYYPFGMLMPQRSFTLPRYVPTPENCLPCAELRAFYAEYLMQNQNIDDPGLISALHAAYPQFDQLSSTQIMEACMFELVNGEMVWEEGANPGAAICPDGNIHQQLVYDQEGYRFGFNGKENDNEVKGAGNQQDYGMRVYDQRLGKFLSVDPLAKDYPWYTPYQFAGNKPIWASDIDGLEEFIRTDYFNAAGNLYKTVVQMVSTNGASSNTVTVHNSRVDETRAGNFVKQYVSTSQTNRTTSFGGTPLDAQIRRSVLHLDSRDLPERGNLPRPQTVTTRNIATSATSTGIATSVEYLPNTARKNLGFYKRYYSAGGADLGIEDPQRSYGPTTMIFTSTDNPIYSARVPANDNRIPLNTNAVPYAPSQRTDATGAAIPNGFAGTVFSAAEGNNGTPAAVSLSTTQIRP